MAGGIDWFRWHHGSVTDPKFQLVARKSGASLPDVLAVWAYLLEQASASEHRGHIGEIDAEALDCLFGFPSTETRTANILAAFQERGLIDGLTVASWEKRQPKRERDTDSSAERTRAYRERQQATKQTNQSHVTPCDATEHQKNARGEESREEKREEGEGGAPAPEAAAPRKRSATPSIEQPADVDQQTWADWLALRKAKKAPVTETVLAGARTEACSAGMTLDAFLQVWCVRGSQGLQADWLKPHERQVQGRTTYAEQDEQARRRRWEEMTGRKWPTDGDVIDITPNQSRIAA